MPPDRTRSGGRGVSTVIHGSRAEFIGPNGAWSLVRRTDADTDHIFHAMLTHQIAAELTRTVLDERDAVTVIVPAENEPLGLTWEPAPLVMWADPVVPEPSADAAPLPTIGSSRAIEARAA